MKELTQADRLLWILYRKIPLTKHFDIFVDWMGRNPLRSGPDNPFELQAPFEPVSPFMNLVRQEYMRVYPANYSEDELGLIIGQQAALAEEKYDSKNALYLFLHYANKMLYFQDRRIHVRFDYLLEWNGFVNKIDANIFLAAVSAVTGQTESCAHLFATHDNMRLHKTLGYGYAENHMHFKGSGLNAEMNWAHFLSKSGISRANGLQKFCGENFGNHSQHEQDLWMLAFKKLRLIRLFLGTLVEGRADLSLQKTVLSLLMTNSNDAFELRYFSNQETLDLAGAPIELWLMEMHNNHDKIYEYVEKERTFVRKLFDMILSPAKNRLLVYLANLYVAGITQFKFCLLQDNAGMGFAKFKQAEDQKELFLPESETKALYRSIFDKYYDEKYVRKVEFRIAPKKVRDLTALMRDMEKINKKAHTANGSAPMQYGLIIHMIKNKAAIQAKGMDMRKESLREIYLKNAQQICKVFEYNSGDASPKAQQDDEIVAVPIVGIDACNYELNCGPEYFAETYRMVRGELACRQKIGFTFHVGEDFQTLCSGLRFIDETLEFMNYKAGDRLGHAIALGLDVAKYFETKRHMLTSTVQEYVDDLCWMYQLIYEEQPESQALLIYLHTEFKKVVGKLYPQTTQEYQQDILAFAHAWLLRGDNPSTYLNSELYPENGRFEYSRCGEFKYQLNHQNPRHRECFEDAHARTLYRGYHYDRRVKQNANTPVTMAASDIYVQSVTLCQQLLHRKIYQRGVHIETNPSSNRKISAVSKFIDLPINRMNQHKLRLNNSPSDTAEPISVSINTDDSAIFQTNLSNEYALLCASYFREGYERESVYEQMDYLRRASMEYSFINDSKT